MIVYIRIPARVFYDNLRQAVLAHLKTFFSTNSFLAGQTWKGEWCASDITGSVADRHGVWHTTALAVSKHFVNSCIVS